MKSKVFTSRSETWEKALQQYLTTTQPNLRKRALDSLAEQLFNPRQILEASELTDSHPLRKEALVVSDAFEAVTNGMSHPGVMEALEELPRDSLFSAWKHLIFAVHFFYQDLQEAVEAHLAKIVPPSPLCRLKGVFTLLLDPKRVSGNHLTPLVQNFLEDIFEADPRWQRSFDHLNDALESPTEEAFWPTLEGLMTDLTSFAEGEAKALALWAWNQLAWQNFDEDRLLKKTSELWGRAEAYRLAALGSLGWDPEGALLLWGRFLVSGVLEASLDPDRLEEAWKVFLDFIRAVLDFQSEQGSVEGWNEDWRSLVHGWKIEAGLHRLTTLLLPEDWKDVRAFVAAPTHVGNLAKRTLRPSQSRSSSPEQLDLFA